MSKKYKEIKDLLKQIEIFPLVFVSQSYNA